MTQNFQKRGSYARTLEVVFGHSHPCLRAAWAHLDSSASLWLPLPFLPKPTLFSSPVRSSTTSHIYLAAFWLLPHPRVLLGSVAHLFSLPRQRVWYSICHTGHTSPHWPGSGPNRCGQGGETHGARSDPPKEMLGAGEIRELFWVSRMGLGSYRSHHIVWPPWLWIPLSSPICTPRGCFSPVLCHFYHHPYFPLPT